MHSSRMRTARFSDHLERGVSDWGVCPGGVSPGGCRSLPTRVSVWGVSEGMIDACENITLPQTSFAGGKYGLVSRSLNYKNSFIGFTTQSLSCTVTRVNLMPQYGHRYNISSDNITWKFSYCNRS